MLGGVRSRKHGKEVTHLPPSLNSSTCMEAYFTACGGLSGFLIKKSNGTDIFIFMVEICSAHHPQHADKRVSVKPNLLNECKGCFFYGHINYAAL